MNILIGCEYTGTVRDAFAALGHNAYSCDLLRSEKPGNHLQMDVIKAIKYGGWDMIGLHLPCTAIALCGNSTYGKGMVKNKERINSIRWTSFVYDLARFVCPLVYFENPANVMGPYIGKKTQSIQPYEYGHPEKKLTWLWLNGLPQLIGTNNVYEEMMLLPKCKRERIHYMSNVDNRGLERSRTFSGVAEAMASQWG